VPQIVSVTYTPIGRIHSQFSTPRGTPIQAAAARHVAGTVELDPAYVEGLHDLDGFSHLILVYHCHRARPCNLTVTPFLDDAPRGVFATRAPSRPNPIGISVVRLTGITGNVLHIRDVDIVDGTPLLDLKPYVPAFDARHDARSGWLRRTIDTMDARSDDGRFALDEEGDGR
jgi:tRNA-Thr(GGU) m(6)t(6)A37 methyltransferase TsaA